jgi:arabinose-5-phosphate isomerase
VSSEIREQAKKVFAIEAQAVAALATRVNDDFDKAIQLMFDCTGKVITTGIGKSGIIARKIASTLASTGTTSIFLHPAESSHGDMGVISNGDVLLVLSYRGEADELNAILSFASRKGLPVIALTGNKDSRLSKAATVMLDVSVSTEACPLNLAPTASTTAALAMGDALAMALLVKRGFKSEDFAEYHPGGSLGRKLLRVRDLMHSGDAVPIVSEDTNMKQVISMMTAKEVRGIAAVTDIKGDLIGVITDGELRRRLEKLEDPLSGVAGEIMSRNPKTIDADEMAERALFVMEEFKIQYLFVVDKGSGSPKKPIGALHFSDLLGSRQGLVARNSKPISDKMMI